MAKEVQFVLRLRAKGGQANPAPPIGPALGAKGVNIMEFCKQFNARTQDRMGQIVPVLITIYNDKSFEFVTKTTPTTVLLGQAAKLTHKKANSKNIGASAEPNRKKVGKVSWDDIERIAEVKMPDLNCFTKEAAMKMVAGTARTMGLTIEGTAPWSN